MCAPDLLGFLSEPVPASTADLPWNNEGQVIGTEGLALSPRQAMQRAASLETRRGANILLTGTTQELAGEGALHDMVWAQEVPSIAFWLLKV